jgi:hypothetical protein
METSKYRAVSSPVVVRLILDLECLLQLLGYKVQLDETKLRKALNSKTIKGISACKVCGQEQWTYDTTVYELREFLAGGLRIGGGGIVPCVVMTCVNCGNMNLINAVALGVLDKNGNPV